MQSDVNRNQTSVTQVRFTEVNFSVLHTNLGKCLYYYIHIYPLSYGFPVRERYGSTLLPATREQHDQNCTQSH